MIQLIVLKVYKYRGATIYVRQLGGDVIEFLVLYKNKLYCDPFGLSHDIKRKEIGAAMLMVCQSAEGLVDLLKKKYSIWYNLIGKYFDVKIQTVEQKPKLHS